MPASLTVCLGCARHVRAGASECPFCAGPLAAPRPPRLVARRSRAAILGVALSAVTTGCYQSHERLRDGEIAELDAGRPPPDECPDDVPECSVTLYGGPASPDLLV